MTAPFDPYHKWLGIPPAHQPPTHYRLLGVEPFEADPEVIEAAANQRVAYLQDLAVGERMKESQKLLNEVAAARRVLLNPEKKAAYDSSVRAAKPPAPAPLPAPQFYVPAAAPPIAPAPAPALAADTDPGFPTLSFDQPAARPRAAKPKPPPPSDKPAPAAPASDVVADGGWPKPWKLVAGGLGCVLLGFTLTAAVLLLGGKPAAKPSKRAAATPTIDARL